MRHFFTLLLTIGSLLAYGQSKNITMSCDLKNCGADSINLYEFNGMSFDMVKAAKGENRVAKFELNKSTTPRMYYVGFSISDLRPVILGTEDNVNINVVCEAVKKSDIPGSPINKAYDGLLMKLSEIRFQENQIFSTYTSSQRTEKNEADFKKSLADLDKRKISLKDSLMKINAFLGNTAAINTYLSFANNKGKYTDEIDYFANEFFKQSKLDDKNLEQNPWVTEIFKAYTQTLQRVGRGNTYIINSIRTQLKKIPQTSNTYRLALGGVVSGIEQNTDVLFVEFADEFSTKYAKTNSMDIGLLKPRLDAIKQLMIGLPAPDFTLETPDGKKVSLKDFKGKVVLIDFWASWCGPCRRENPNVVAMYNRYKNKGFEILGVSLDRSKEPWIKAIADDKLTWPHVSDLKGWGSSAAALYGITSIPHTVLVDRDGRIVARQLRGEVLGKKLEEILGGK